MSEGCSGGRPCILIVDDNVDHVEIVRMALGSRYDVLTASDGLDGYALACIHRPGAIVLDVMMPLVDGYTVLRKLRTNPLTAAIPVILETALGAGDLETSSIAQFGVSSVLRKPFHAGEIITALSKVLPARDVRVPG